MSVITHLVHAWKLLHYVSIWFCSKFLFICYSSHSFSLAAFIIISMILCRNNPGAPLIFVNCLYLLSINFFCCFFPFWCFRLPGLRTSSSSLVDYRNLLLFCPIWVFSAPFKVECSYHCWGKQQEKNSQIQKLKLKPKYSREELCSRQTIILHLSRALCSLR